MEILKKTLKVYVMCFVMFCLLSFLIAIIICFTPFKEEWSFYTLIAILTLMTFFLGYLEAGIVGKRGIVVGAAAALIYMIMIILFSENVFQGGSVNKNNIVFYIIPLISGTVGGIFGANRR